MSTKSAAPQKKIDAAVRILQKNTTDVRVPQPMILAGFAKPDVVNKIVHQRVRHCLQQKQRVILTSN